VTDIRGICPIIALPFTEAGEVDYGSMRNLVRTLIEGGCHGLTLFGIGGEYYKLNDDERRLLIELVVGECKKGGVPSIISITQHATEVAVKEAQYAEEAGADCLMVLPPFFLKPTAGDLYAHMKSVGEAVRIPAVIQYVPQHTGVTIDPVTFARLSDEVNNITYYKIECKPPGAYITRLLEIAENRVKVLVGSAGLQLIEGLDRGAVGAMPGCSMYEIYLKIYDHHVQGNREEAIRIHSVLVPMLNHILQRTEMIIYYEKKILQRRGIIQSDYCRMPTFTADKYYNRLFEEYYQQISPYLG
jgi:dihydrodipicolinate synthase/N-acetylneuraminate lyase